MSTQTPAAPAEAETAASSLTAKTVCLQLRLGGLGTRQRVDAEEVEVDADKDMLHVSKDILQSMELKAVRRQAAEIRAYVRAMALPSILRGGIYLLPVTLIPGIEARLEEMRAVRKGLVQKFVDAYPQLVVEAKERLRDLFNEGDYPVAGRVKGAFTMDVRYLTFGTPSQLKEISADLWAREQKKAERAWEVASVEITNLLRAEFQKLVNHMVERLTPDADGKPKVFRGTLVANFAQYMESFNPRNVTNDTELAKLVDQARDLLNGIDAQTLRDNDSLRGQTGEAFAGIKATLDTMVVDKPKRLISLDDDEAEA